MYRIYINGAVLIISESDLVSFSGCKYIKSSDFDLWQFYRQIVSENLAGVYVMLSPNPSQLLENIKSSVKLISTGGGLVRNEHEEALFIFRKGKWDLPKGKIEDGETSDQAAAREVEEECGIKIDRIGAQLCSTYHVYTMERELVLKQTVWYAMEAKNQIHLTPQLEEGITKVCWIPPAHFDMIKQNTYPSIREVMGFIERS